MSLPDRDLETIDAMILTDEATARVKADAHNERLLAFIAEQRRLNANASDPNVQVVDDEPTA